MGCTNSELHVRIFVTSIAILVGTFCVGETDPVDGIVDSPYFLLLYIHLYNKNLAVSSFFVCC